MGGSRNSLAGLWTGEAGNGYLPGVLSGVLLGAAIMTATLYYVARRKAARGLTFHHSH